MPALLGMLFHLTGRDRRFLDHRSSHGPSGRGNNGSPPDSLCHNGSHDTPGLKLTPGNVYHR